MTDPLILEPAKLIALEANIQPLEFTIEADICTLGRSPACHVVVTRQVVSRLHARIERDEAGRYLLSDAQSANGTFINGRPQPLQEPYRLRHEDTIGLGLPDPLFRFEDRAATAPVLPSRLSYQAAQLLFFLDQQPLDLTPTQLRLMQHLYHHAYDLCTRASCAKALWGRDYDPILDDQALDRIVSNLRQQLRRLAPDAEFIVTRRGVGYILVLTP